MYNIEVKPLKRGWDILVVGFGQPASNMDIVKDVVQKLSKLILGGTICLINGPASLPVAFVMCHKLAHLYSVIGIFDPKLQGYVVAVSHSPDYAVGDLITQFAE